MTSICQILATLLASILIGGLGPQGPGSKATTQGTARGKKLFVAHCALCHGIGGTGGRGPSLNHPQPPRAADNRALFKIIQGGIDGTEMPGAWQLTDPEILEIVDYVKSLGRTSVVNLPGDPVKGKEYYETKGGCAACHILSGRGGTAGPDLTDIGARRSATYLREALLDPAAAVPDGFLIVNVVKRDGQKVRGIRTNEDSFTIQLRDANNVFHSFRKGDLAELKKESGTSVMPAYRDVFNASQIGDLVAYLAGRRGEK